MALQDLEDLDNNLFNEMSTEMSGTYSKDELREQLVQAIEDRDFSRLGFMKEFFKEGSLARSLVESDVEMMWLNDWYNHAECTYGIAVDREKKQVLLSFRGAFTKADWTHAKDIKFTSTGNPVEDSYPGRPNTIKLHSGFHKYLFRIRKDTSTTKYDEIAEKLALYCDQLGEGAKVIVTGHSLGAALTTVFSLYASTDERFTRSSALEAVPFGGPYVGGYTFADAVRYQENQGKLRIARFHNAKDGVCHLPPAFASMSKRGAVYFSNGIDVKLPMIRKGLCGFLPQPQPKIKFMGKESFMGSWTRQLREFYFFNLPLRVWKSSKMHSLHETKLRLELTKLLDDPESSPMAKYSLEELYGMRDNLGK
jgi:pimeloyl-ACP methyl ester carboxylesterase